MKITFISLFPNFFESFKEYSIIKNAIRKNLVEIEQVSIWDFVNEDNKADDYVYGGGSGMLLMIEPIAKAIASVKQDNSKVILLSPRGSRFVQSKAKSLSNEEHIILISGHYEGIDARIKNYIDEEISIGDFIVTGGEIPSTLIAESIIRLIPDVIKKESHENESFENNLLEYDQYTRPEEFDGHKVPEVLLSGDHNKILNFRKQSAIKITIDNLLEERNNNGNQ